MLRSRPSQHLLVLVIAVVFVGSLLMLFVRQPEQVVAVSAEGRLRIEGLVREAVGVKIETIDLSKNQYALSIDRGRVLEDVTMTFFGKKILEQEAQLFLFDRSLTTWTEHPLLFDEQKERFSLHLNRLGSTELRIKTGEIMDSVDNENLLY